MILPVMVVGTFETPEGTPLSGRIEFNPRDLWVEHDGQAWASLSGSCELRNGAFTVMLTPGVLYKVVTPYGVWPIKIDCKEPVQRLRDLIPNRFYEELKFPE